ncbi:MAG TPA: hypothetical protein VM681_02275 [Candidatus Thermoplasmatota archaeon]|nr:hypothetical protein [Candidatus Thermoplasmatota archaeon]
MPVSRLSISVTPELAAALRALAKERSEDVSRLVENLLRENPLVQEAVQSLRGGRPVLKKGRDLRELLLLGRAADRQWRDRIASGRVTVEGG